MLNFQHFEVLSFDCYGTLIDWENGILSALKTILSNHDINISEQQILELFAQRESIQEAGDYLKYREILKRVVQNFGIKLRFTPTEAELNSLAESIQNWQPFPDTVEALRTLKKRYKLAIISNIDNELFDYTANKLGVEFDWIITAEQVKSYKPSLQNFEFAIGQMGISPDKLLHVAQSVYHDIVPAKTMGLTAVWVNRRQGKEGFGATVPATGNPDLEVPDLRSLVSLMGLD
ncbi:MAG: haloacid dehalogenase type II [Coleofasciculus sp. Co-bin14]|nr:haloacid dehalogenase type II [Coleofasciculus sp. Co-bin14]